METRSKAVKYKKIIIKVKSHMYFVYCIRSINNSEQTYIGYATDVSQRLKTHNSGGSIHTAKYMPWVMVTYVAFDSLEKAKSFEKYIKFGSGNAWAKKHLW
jgi:putative endonuclease